MTNCLNTMLPGFINDAMMVMYVCSIGTFIKVGTQSVKITMLFFIFDC